jgi:predicted AlkP superfamily pyrophosphatase or phosphodiesterase
LFGSIFLSSLIAVTVRSQAQTPAQKPSGPRLMVLVVVDQMRADYFQRYAFTDGFKRLAEGGAVFADARYVYASTKTAEAHALMLSGWSPSGTGIVGDGWYDRHTGMNVTAGTSATHKLVGSTAEGGSPEQLLVHTVGDALKAEHPNAIVLTASWKRYAAILNGGQHPDGAYWFDAATGHFVTSDYYVREYPSWVSQFNQVDLTAPYFGTTWLTHRLGTGEKPSAASRNAVQNTPYANDILLGFAQALIKDSGAGKDAQPDLVAISFSALDLVGHQYGPETPEFDATMMAQDRQIGDLLRTLDASVGAGNYTVALTADHGAPLTPEKEQARGVDAGRLNTQAFRSAVEQAVTAKLKIAGPVIAAMSLPELYLYYGAVAGKGVSRSALDRAVVDAIEAQPGVARAYTVDDVMTADASNDPLLKAVAAGYYADRSGDIHVLVKPNYIFWTGMGTTHGTPYDYDNHVPLILFGSGIKPGQYRDRTRLNDLAPTIGQLLGIKYKGDPQGRVLSEALQ